jgi:hypothetical protein
VIGNWAFFMYDKVLAGSCYEDIGKGN